jgi:hypothetical protein
MRKSVFFLIFLASSLIAQNTYAQENNKVNTLLSSGPAINTENLGFFLAPSYGLTSMDGSTVSLFNLRGGVTMKDQLSVGAYFSTSLNQINPESETVQEVYMDYWTVGGFAEYTIWSKKAFHLTLPLYIGYGEVEMDNEGGDAELGEQNFFKIEPSALLEVNLNKYVRINMGVGYRFVAPMEYRNLNQSDISGLTGYLGLKFGIFN